MLEFETTQQGSRIATSVGGVLTGRGADIVVIDDPLKPEEALSQAQREAVNEWYEHTLYSIMHRLHEDDLAGHVLAQEDWEVVHLPARRTSCTGSTPCSAGSALAAKRARRCTRNASRPNARATPPHHRQI